MSRLRLLYIGSVVPDVARFHTRAFNRAGNMAQANLLRELAAEGLAPTIVSQRPWQLFPRSRTWWFTTERVDIEPGLPATLVGFANLPVLRPVSVGLRTVVEALRWRFQLPRGARPVVCAFNLTEPSGLFILLAARLAGATAVAWVNDVFVPGQLIPATVARRLDFALQRWVLPRFDGLVVVSDAIADDFAAHVPRLRVEGGISDVMLTVRPKRAATEGQPLTIAAVASLEEHNGVRQIIEAFGLLSDSTARLVIAGTGALRPVVEAAAREDPRITYLGFLEFDRVLDLYETVDVLVSMRLTRYPGTRYFFPSKMMEFLASGVPVITTAPPGIGEEFAEAAFVLEDDSAAALARMIRHVEGTPSAERYARADRARAIVAATRTWPAQARRVAHFLEQVAGATGEPA